MMYKYFLIILLFAAVAFLVPAEPTAQPPGQGRTNAHCHINIKGDAVDLKFRGFDEEGNRIFCNADWVGEPDPEDEECLDLCFGAAGLEPEPPPPGGGQCGPSSDCPTGQSCFDGTCILGFFTGESCQGAEDCGRSNPNLSCSEFRCESSECFCIP